MSSIRNVVVVIATFVSIICGAGEVKTVNELLKKHLDACGGEKYLKMKGLYVEGVMASKEMTSKFQVALEFPGRMTLKTQDKYPTVLLMDKNRVMSGYRGRNGIRLSIIEDQKDGSEGKMLQDPYHLVRLTTYFPKATLEAVEKVDGTDCYHVRANATDNAKDDYHYYFDQSTFLLKCVRAKLKTMNNASVEAIVKKYEKRDGIALVQHVAVTLGFGRQNMAVDLTLSKTILNPEKKRMGLFDGEAFQVRANLQKNKSWIAMGGRYKTTSEMLKDVQMVQSFGFVPSYKVYVPKSTTEEERKAIAKKLSIKPDQIK